MQKNCRGKWVLMTLLSLTISACSNRVDASSQVGGLMPAEWEPQLSGAPLRFNASLSIVEYRGDFWTTTWAHDVLGPGMLLRFRPTTKTAKQYTVQQESGTGIPSSLLITARGDMWGAGMNPLAPESFRLKGCDPDLLNGQPLGPMPWVLSRYDPEGDRFKPVQDKEGLLRGCEVRGLAEDKNGNLWLIIDDGLRSPLYHSDPNVTSDEWKEAARIGRRPRIFRFNPDTYQAVFIDLNAELDALSLERVNDIVGGPDGAMWIEAQGENRTQDKVLRYELETGKVQDMGTPSQQYDTNSRLYFDRQGRLWTSHVAWADVGQSQVPSWHALNATLFFMAGQWPGDDLKSIVAQIYQTSDGRMWFTTGPGLITYDLEKDLWTRVTTSNSAIVQDENGYIWTAAYGQFYRYKPMR